MPQSQQIRYPFDLLPDTYYQIVITREVASNMHHASEIERKTVELIAKNWTDRANTAIVSGGLEPPFGLSIPRRWGLTGPERKKMSDTSEQDRIHRLKSTELIKKITKETNASVEEIRARLVAEDPELIEKYTDELIEIDRPTETPDPFVVIATTYIQRVIPDWKIENTEALAESILQDIAEFHRLEHEGMVIEKKDQQPLIVSQPKSSSSGNTENQTGIRSNQISYTGGSQLSPDGESSIYQVIA